MVVLAVAWWLRTGGRFDPTVLPALVAAGYGVTFEAVGPQPEPARASDYRRSGPGVRDHADVGNRRPGRHTGRRRKAARGRHRKGDEPA